MGRAPRTKETLPDFLKWRRVTRHPLGFRGLTGSQRTPGFWGVTEILELVKVVDCYPNVSIAYRILLTMPVTVASAERSFSKLKLLKSYLRLSMSQERLNDLTILCIEKNMLENIDVDTIINDFASRNARRQCFL